MTRMKMIAVRIGLVAVLALLGTATAQAYDFPKADSPYHCKWERYNTSTGQLINKGVSLVTFTNVTEPNFYTQNGTLFTVYADAGTLTRNYQVQLHVAFGGLTFTQDNPAPQADVTCELVTNSGANTVQWIGCSNGVRQWCYQP
jgi:hypothetical protein